MISRACRSPVFQAIVQVRQNKISIIFFFKNVFFFGFWFDALCPSQQHGHVRTVSSPNHTFFLNPGQA